MIESDEIKRVIEDTIEKVNAHHRDSKPVIEIARPTTMRGWVLVIGGAAAFLSFIYSAIVYVHGVSEHHKSPHHKGAEVLVERIEKSLTSHANNGEHHTEAELQLKIIEETRPMKQDIQRIQQDVGSIKTKVDILIDRESR